MKNERLIAKRTELGLSQKELAERVGISQSMISRVENGERSLDDENKIKIAQVLGVSVEWLFFESLYDQKLLTDQSA